MYNGNLTNLVSTQLHHQLKHRAKYMFPTRKHKKENTTLREKICIK